MRKIVIEKEESAGYWDLRFRKPEARICPVCSTEIEEGAPVFECPHCGNIMHRRCVQPWIESRGTCPICKRPLSREIV